MRNEHRHLVQLVASKTFFTMNCCGLHSSNVKHLPTGKFRLFLNRLSSFNPVVWPRYMFATPFRCWTAVRLSHFMNTLFLNKQIEKNHISSNSLKFWISWIQVEAGCSDTKKCWFLRITRLNKVLTRKVLNWIGASGIWIRWNERKRVYFQG